MIDPHTPRTASPPDPARMVAIVFAIQLSVITRLALDRDEWQRVADTRLGALELLEEAERTNAYWRTRALDAEEKADTYEGLVDALRRAQSMHACRTDSSKETS